MHLRKAKSEDDPMDEINSSTGASATADGTLILKRPRGEAVGTLWGTGRDYEEDVNLAVTFDNGIWKILGDARRQVKLTPGSKEIIDILIEANRPMMPQQLAAYLQIGAGAMRKRLSDMKGKGEISDTGKGYISNISLEENRYVLKNINGGNGGNAQQYQGSFTSPQLGNASTQEGNVGGNAQQYSEYVPSEEPVERRNGHNGHSHHMDECYLTLPLDENGGNALWCALEAAPEDKNEGSVTSVTSKRNFVNDVPLDEEQQDTWETFCRVMDSDMWAKVGSILTTLPDGKTAFMPRSAYMDYARAALFDYIAWVQAEIRRCQSWGQR
jgi:hypothetical protein